MYFRAESLSLPSSARLLDMCGTILAPTFSHRKGGHTRQDIPASFYRSFYLFSLFLAASLGQFTRNYTQTVKRAADNKRRYAPGWVHSTCLLRGFPKGAAPHLAHDFAEQSVVCYTLCRRCPENTVAAGEGKGI